MFDRLTLTDVLDLLALLLLAAGLGAGVARWIGWFGLAVAAVVMFAGSALAARAARPAPKENRR